MYSSGLNYFFEIIHASTPFCINNHTVKPKTPLSSPPANLALRQLREVVGLTQAEIADRLELSKPFIQAVEQGTRRANRVLALRCMSIYGVWHECILDHWTEAVDLYGQTYTYATWDQYIALQPERFTEEKLKEVIQPIVDLFQAAAATGKLRVLGLSLYAQVGDLLQIQGIGEGLHRVYRQRSSSKVIEYTFGKLRADPTIAMALGFVDNPRRNDADVAFRVEPAVDKSQPLFPLSEIYPHPGTISERYRANKLSTEESTR